MNAGRLALRRPGGEVRWDLVLRVGFALWVGGLVALPLAAVAARAAELGVAGSWAAVTAPDAVAAVALSCGLALTVATLDVLFGLAIAWCLVRWSFPGRGWLAAAVDLPFAVPTLVAGVLLVVLAGPQTWLGRGLASLGVEVVYAIPGMVLALCFVTLPFVVRAVEPVLAELDPAEEEAARMMGARPWQVFVHVLLPPLRPALVVGAAQSFARAVGEFGAMAVVSGNVPRETLVGSVYVLGEVEAGEVPAAAATALLLLAVSVAVQLGSRRLGRPGRSP